MRIAAIIFAVLALGGVAARAEDTHLGTAGLRSEAKMLGCLNRHIAGAGAFQHWHPTKDSPPGEIGEIAIIYITGSRFDDANLYFFKTAALARAGEAKLVAVEIYGVGSPPILKALLRIPPTAAAARTRHEVSGNVVVIWQYPRHYRVYSEKILNTCFAVA